MCTSKAIQGGDPPLPMDKQVFGHPQERGSITCNNDMGRQAALLGMPSPSSFFPQL